MGQSSSRYSEVPEEIRKKSCPIPRPEKNLENLPNIVRNLQDKRDVESNLKEISKLSTSAVNWFLLCSKEMGMLSTIASMIRRHRELDLECKLYICEIVRKLTQTNLTYENIIDSEVQTIVTHHSL